IPLLSPNNDARKIREAARQLNSMFAQAQAQAQRDGRPYGVAFREFGTTNPFSGMALEAFFIAEPSPFAGFSQNARVWLAFTGDVYGAAGNEGTRFSPEHDGKPIYRLTFVDAGTGASPPPASPLPPRTFKIGDTIEVAGNHFLIADDGKDGAAPNEIEQVPVGPGQYEDYLASTAEVDCIWLDFNRGHVLALTPPNSKQPVLKSYRVRRQPRYTADLPLQFPRGIGIDMQVSGLPGPANNFDRGGQDSVALMFRPDGGLGDVYHSNPSRHRVYDRVDRVFFLLGRVENGNNGTQDENDYDFAATPVTDDELAQRRRRINWLNADSRWVTVAHSGRIITSENNLFDPRQARFIADPDVDVQRREQIEAARAHARDMLGTGGR
ncbi:hypothetical protein DCC79_08120, partial [bacterium]